MLASILLIICVYRKRRSGRGVPSCSCSLLFATRDLHNARMSTTVPTHPLIMAPTP